MICQSEAWYFWRVGWVAWDGRRGLGWGVVWGVGNDDCAYAVLLRPASLAGCLYFLVSGPRRTIAMISTHTQFASLLPLLYACFTVEYYWQWWDDRSVAFSVPLTVSQYHTQLSVEGYDFRRNPRSHICFFFFLSFINKSIYSGVSIPRWWSTRCRGSSRSKIR